jgi:predicted amidohydrolase YtcJ
LREAFAGYTLGPAVTAGTAEVQGVLQPHAYADFAVWRSDPLAQPVEDLLDLQVAATVVGGEVVYEA